MKDGDFFSKIKRLLLNVTKLHRHVFENPGYKWGAFHKSIGCPETGMSYFKKYTNKVWPTCVKLEKQKRAT